MAVAPPPPHRPGVLRQPSMSVPSLPHFKHSSSSSSTSSWPAASADLGRHHDSLSKKRPTPSRPALGLLFKRDGQKVPLPPVRKEPAALAYYSSSWRRQPSLPVPVRPFASSMSGHPRAASDEEVFGALRRPNRRFVSNDVRGSWSSSASSAASPQEELVSASVTPPGGAPPMSPHDLRAAARRTRAPVLRTFVPCAAFTDAVISACADQLAYAGLYDVLSAGDLVCNLGYVPSHADDQHESGTRREDEVRTWLLFDGTELKVYVPPAAPPLPRPGQLPSPLYYAHVLPAIAAPPSRPPALGLSGVAMGRTPPAAPAAGVVNPRFVLTLPKVAAPALALVPDFSTLVRAPGAPRGRAKVNTHVWTARMRATAAPGLGAGWAGEWVFEAPGTWEGRQGVLDALGGGGAQASREWEVVRERCAAGTLWFRLIDDVPHARTISTAH